MRTVLRLGVRALLSLMLRPLWLMFTVHAHIIVVGPLLSLVCKMSHAPVIECGSLFHDVYEILELLEHRVDAFGIGYRSIDGTLVDQVIVTEVSE